MRGSGAYLREIAGAAVLLLAAAPPFAFRSRSNMAHRRQSGPDTELGLQKLMQMFERSEAVPSSSSALLSTLEQKRRSRTGVVEKRKGYPREMAGAAVLLLAAAPPFAFTCSTRLLVYCRTSSVSLLPNNQRQRRTCYAVCHILHPVSAVTTTAICCASAPAKGC